MSDAIHAIAAAGIDLQGFIALWPGLRLTGTSSSTPWPDDESGLAVAEFDGFILATGDLLAGVGEALAVEASRPGRALYLCEDEESDGYCAAKFAKGLPAGRAEVLSGDLVEDSMGYFSDSVDCGFINIGELLVKFIGGNLRRYEWMHYSSKEEAVS